MTVAAAGVLTALGACARLAGLEDSNPAQDENLPSLPDGGGGGSFPANEAGAIISPLKIEVSTSCGTLAEAAYIKIQNTGDRDIPFEVKSPSPDIIALKGETGNSLESVKGVVVAHKVELVYTKVISSTPGTVLGELFVTTGDDLQQVPVQITIKGGSLALSPTLIDFGQVRQDTSTPPQPVTLENTGNEPITVESWRVDGGTDFTMSTGSLTIAPGVKAASTATFVAGSAGAPLSAGVSPQTQMPTCNAAPTLTLKGQRVNQAVTVNPGTIGFGEIDCNTASANAPKTITVSNFSPNTVATFNVALKDGADAWLVVNPASGSVNPAAGATPGTAPVTVNLKPIGSVPGDLTGSIQITTAGPETGTKTVIASLRVKGALLEITPAALSGFTAGQTKQFTVKNTGNDFIYLRHSSSSTAFVIANGTDETPLYPPGDFFPNALKVDVKLNTAGTGTHAAEITTVRTSSGLFFPTSGRLCNVPTVVQASAVLP
jgi:hypothetical protein